MGLKTSSNSCLSIFISVIFSASHVEVVFFFKKIAWVHTSQKSYDSCFNCACLFVFAGPPQIVSNADRRLTEDAGNTVRLTCHVDSDPPTLVQWMKWNEDIQDDEIING